MNTSTANYTAENHKLLYVYIRLFLILLVFGVVQSVFGVKFALGFCPPLAIITYFFIPKRIMIEGDVVLIQCFFFITSVNSSKLIGIRSRRIGGLRSITIFWAFGSTYLIVDETGFDILPQLGKFMTVNHER